MRPQNIQNPEYTSRIRVGAFPSDTWPVCCRAVCFFPFGEHLGLLPRRLVLHCECLYGYFKSGQAKSYYHDRRSLANFELGGLPW